MLFSSFTTVLPILPTGVLRDLCHHLLMLQPASMSLMVDLSTSNFLTLLAIPQKSPSFTTNEQMPPKRNTS